MNLQELEEVLSFLVTSARGCIDEPPIYGPLRLLETYSRLVDVFREQLDAFFSEEKAKIDVYMEQAMFDEQAFTEGIDQTILSIARFIKQNRF